GDEVHVVHASAHYEQASRRDHQHLHDARRELHAAHKAAHGLEVAAARRLVFLIRGDEFLVLGLFIGKGLGRAYAGDAGFYCRVYLRSLPFYLEICLFHAHPAREREEYEQRQAHRQNQREPPFDPREHDERTEDGEDAYEYVLRPVVRELRDLEQVRGYPAHEHTRAILVKEGERELLHVVEHRMPHVRLYVDAHPVSQDGDEVIH